MSLHDRLWMPRPLHMDEPGWVWIDLEGSPEFFRDIEAAARTEGLPVNVWIRKVLILTIRALEGDVNTKGLMHDEGA